MFESEGKLFGFREGTTWYLYSLHQTCPDTTLEETEGTSVGTTRKGSGTKGGVVSSDVRGPRDIKKNIVHGISTNLLIT